MPGFPLLPPGDLAAGADCADVSAALRTCHLQRADGGANAAVNREDAIRPPNRTPYSRSTFNCAPRARPTTDPCPQVLISEVCPHDGLQSVRATMPTVHKLAWISALHGAGLREIEVGSFVPATLMPQMADVALVVQHALTLPGLTWCSCSRPWACTPASTWSG